VVSFAKQGHSFVQSFDLGDELGAAGVAGRERVCFRCQAVGQQRQLCE